MLTSSIVQFLGWIAAFVCAFLLGNVFRPFFNSYAAKKGENLATKEDIAQLTKIAEGIKAKISDEVWDRQKQWELKRDTIIDAVRALIDLHEALLDLHSAYSRPITDNSVRNADTASKQKEARESWDSYSARYCRAMVVSDLVAGHDLQKQLADYFGTVGTVADQIFDRNESQSVSSDTLTKLRGIYEDVISAARKELNITKSDCVVL